MMVLGGEELEERRASLLLYPGFSLGRLQKQWEKKRPLPKTLS